MEKKKPFACIEQRERYHLELARFNYKSGHFISFMLIFMEAAMLVYALISFDFSKTVYLVYTVLYCILLIIGICVYAFTLLMKKHLETHYRLFNAIVVVFACLVMTWGAVLSSFDISLGSYPIIFFSFLTGFSALFYLTTPVSLIMLFCEIILFYILNLTLGGQSFDFNVVINYFTYFCIIVAVVLIKDKQTYEKFKADCALQNKDAQLNAMVEKLGAMNKQLIDMAVTDSLTGTYNRWAFNNNIPVLIANCIKNNTPLTAIMYDIDNFKYVNDLYGHEAGDHILKAVCNKLVSHTHKNCVYRFGGEEFVILLENLTQEQSMQLADKIREDVASEVYTDWNIAVTMSGGVYTAVPGTKNDGDEFWIRADNALYKAKHSGKNCIVLFDESMITCRY